jgi:hypothetical protein
LSGAVLKGRQDGAGDEVLVGDVGLEHLDRHREQGRHHQLAKDVTELQSLGFQVAGPEAEAVGRLEHRAEEGEAAHMVEMRVREEQVGVEPPLGSQFAPERAQPGSRIEDEEMRAAADLEARGVAAVAQHLRLRTGDRAADAPKGDGERRVAGHLGWVSQVR